MRVPLPRWILCLLHLHLRIVSGAINRTVFDMLGEYGDADAQTEKIREILATGAIWLRGKNLKKKAAKSKDLTTAYMKDVSFNLSGVMLPAL